MKFWVHMLWKGGCIYSQHEIIIKEVETLLQNKYNLLIISIEVGVGCT